MSLPLGVTAHADRATGAGRPGATIERTEHLRKPDLNGALQTARQSRRHAATALAESYPEEPEGSPQAEAVGDMMEVFEDVERRIERLLQRTDQTI